MQADFKNEAQSNDAPSSAYERAGQDGSDPRCIPQTLDGPPPVGADITAPEYTAQDHANWSYLFRRQMNLLTSHASSAFFDGVRVLGMTEERIPLLSELSNNMAAATGWRIARIPGLLHESDFLGMVSDRVFPSTDYVRGADELDYTPAPDCFHDMFGHMPMLTEPHFADFYQMFGKASLNATGTQRTMLETLHWFTVEFGLVRRDGQTGIFGAGILSSKDEVGHAMNGGAEIVNFSMERVTTQEYDVWHLQPVLFVLDSFEQLMSEFKTWASAQGILN